MYPFIHAIEVLLAGSWGTFAENALEWSASIVSLIAFYQCILKKPSSFLVFLWADGAWFVSALLTHHWALVVQQVLYMAMNIAGYLIWKREAMEEQLWENAYRELQQQVKQLSAKLEEFELDDLDDEELETSVIVPLPRQAVGVASPVPAPTVEVPASVTAVNAASAASAESTSCLASVRSAASCSPAR